MKKLFTLLLATMCAVCTWAEDFEVDGIYYNILTDKTNEVEVTYGYWYDEYSGSVTIPSTVTYNGTTYSVTSIVDWAFEGCYGLTSPVYNAHCFAYMPASYEGAYTIPEGIKQIACAAFNCSRLTSVTIPNSVTSIGNYAFTDCSRLKSVTIPNSVTSIGEGAFSDCSRLKSITIPNSVTSIGHSAFSGCSRLTSVTIPNCVTSIGEGAFSGCSSLKSVEVPIHTKIADYTFPKHTHIIRK